MHTARAIAAAFFAVIASFVAQAAPVNPPVPPGRDPGGIPVALVGISVDYLQPHIAQRLARDGEGEIIGYDFVENDRRPYCSCPGTEIAEILIGEGQAAKLIVVSARDENLDQFKSAIGFAAATPAKVIMLNTASGPKAEGRSSLIVSAAKHFSDRLFIADGNLADPDVGQPQPNLIWVAAAAKFRDLSGGPSEASKFADLLVAVEKRVQNLDSKEWLSDADGVATARIAALAVRLEAVEPNLTPAAAKARILGLAEPTATAPDKPPLISDPRRHFWLE